MAINLIIVRVIIIFLANPGKSDYIALNFDDILIYYSLKDC